MEYVTRINLKTATAHRNELIDFCLKSEKQFLAIGWSCVYKENSKLNFSDYYQLVKNDSRRINPVLNIFKDVALNDLFWTRDLDGSYWVCRATGKVEMKCDELLDIGALLPVEAYRVGMQVPGQIKASFNRANAGTAQRIRDSIIVEYSKALFNSLSGKDFYSISQLNGNLLDNLPDFDLEELVISYIQIVYDYYVLSNSIANKSTTIKVECEFISRKHEKIKKAVVQVKGKKAPTLDALDFKSLVEDGYEVFLFAPRIKNLEDVQGVIVIEQSDLLRFYDEYKAILPKSVTQWEKLY